MFGVWMMMLEIEVVMMRCNDVAVWPSPNLFKSFVTSNCIIGI